MAERSNSCSMMPPLVVRNYHGPVNARVPVRLSDEFGVWVMSLPEALTRPTNLFPFRVVYVQFEPAITNNTGTC